MKHVPRGYTLTELVVAGALGAVSCLGLLSAVMVAERAEHKAVMLRQVSGALRSLERASPRGLSAPCLVTQALENHPPSRECVMPARLLSPEALRGGGQLQHGPVSYEFSAAWEDENRGLLRLNLVFSAPEGELVRHALVAATR